MSKLISQNGKKALGVIEKALAYATDVSSKVKPHQAEFLIGKADEARKIIRSAMKNTPGTIKYSMSDGSTRVSTDEFVNSNPLAEIAESTRKFVREVELITRDVEYVIEPVINPVNDALQTENADLRTRIGALRATAVLQQAEIARLNTNIASLRQQKTALVGLVHDRDREIVSLRGLVGTLTTERNAARTERDAALEDLATSQAALVANQAALTASQAELVAMTKTRDQLLIDLADRTAELRVVRGDHVAALIALQNQLNQENIRHTAEEAKLEASAEGLGNQLVNTRKKYGEAVVELKTAINGLREHVVERDETIVEKDKTIAEKDETIKQFLETVEKHLATIEEHEATIEEHEATIARRKTELDKEVQRANAAIAFANSQLHDARIKHDEQLRQATVTHDEKVGKLTDEHNYEIAQRKTTEEYEALRTSYENQLSAAEKQFGQMQTSLTDKLTAANKRHAAEVAQLRRAMAEAQTRYDGSLEELRQQLTEAEARYDERSAVIETGNLLVDATADTENARLTTELIIANHRVKASQAAHKKTQDEFAEARTALSDAEARHQKAVGDIHAGYKERLQSARETHDSLLQQTRDELVKQHKLEFDAKLAQVMRKNAEALAVVNEGWQAKTQQALEAHQQAMKQKAASLAYEHREALEALELRLASEHDAALKAKELKLVENYRMHNKELLGVESKYDQTLLEQREALEAEFQQRLNNALTTKAEEFDAQLATERGAHLVTMKQITDKGTDTVTKVTNESLTKDVDIERLTNQVIGLKTKVAADVARATAAEARAAAAEARAVAAEELADSRGQVNSKEAAKMETLKSENRELQTKLLKTEGNIAQYQRELENVRAQLESVSTELERVSAELSQCRQEKANLEKAKSQAEELYRAQLQQKENENTSLQEISALRFSLKQHKHQIEDLNGRLEAQDTEIKTKTKDYNELVDKRMELIRLFTLQEKNYTECKDNLAKRSRELAGLKANIKHIKDEAESNVRNAELKLRDAEGDLEVTEAELARKIYMYNRTNAKYMAYMAVMGVISERLVESGAIPNSSDWYNEMINLVDVAADIYSSSSSKAKSNMHMVYDDVKREIRNRDGDPMSGLVSDNKSNEEALAQARDGIVELQSDLAKANKARDVNADEYEKIMSKVHMKIIKYANQLIPEIPADPTDQIDQITRLLNDISDPAEIISINQDDTPILRSVQASSRGNSHPEPEPSGLGVDQTSKILDAILETVRKDITKKVTLDVQAEYKAGYQAALAKREREAEAEAEAEAKAKAEAEAKANQEVTISGHGESYTGGNDRFINNMTGGDAIIGGAVAGTAGLFSMGILAIIIFAIILLIAYLCQKIYYSYTATSIYDKTCVGKRPIRY